MNTKILFALIISFIVTACKKTYTCSCSNPGGVFKTYEIKDTKKKAEQKCSEYSKEYQSVPFSESGCYLN